jgi:hypothetical protein
MGSWHGFGMKNGEGRQGGEVNIKRVGVYRGARGVLIGYCNCDDAITFNQLDLREQGFWPDFDLKQVSDQNPAKVKTGKIGLTCHLFFLREGRCGLLYRDLQGLFYLADLSGCVAR